jgi:hypothetical protein
LKVQQRESENANLSLISIAKIDPNPEIHYQLYKLYFESVTPTVVSVKSMTKWKTAKNPLELETR